MLGKKIESLRKDHGLTQDALASKLNSRFGIRINKSMISKWENGKESPSLDNVKYIAIIFNVSLDAMLEIDVSAKDDSFVAPLHPQERNLLSLYNGLNSDGQGKAIEYLEILNASGRYSIDIAYDSMFQETLQVAEDIAPVIKPYDGPYADDVARAVERDTQEEFERLKKEIDEIENGTKNKTTLAK